MKLYTKITDFLNEGKIFKKKPSEETKTMNFSELQEKYVKVLSDFWEKLEKLDYKVNVIGCAIYDTGVVVRVHEDEDKKIVKKFKSDFKNDGIKIELAQIPKML